MAQYEHLPIYKQAYSLLVEFHKLVPTFPKKYKFTLGSTIIEDLTSAIVLIIQANSIKDKKDILNQIIIVFEKLKFKTQIRKYSRKKYLTCGFPITSKKIKMLDSLDVNYVIIKQLSNNLPTGLKERIEDKIVSNKNSLILHGGFNKSEDLNSVLNWDLNSMTPIEVFIKLSKILESYENGKKQTKK